MERNVPRTVSEEIELYLRTLYSLLRSTAQIQVRTLEEVHSGMNSLLHLEARGKSPDPSAFIYSIQRLPDCLPQVQTIILGQNPAVFEQHGFSGVETWQKVNAKARRRSCFFDGRSTLACFIGSRTDIEDILPCLTAYQIEWNKLHQLMKRLPPGVDPARAVESERSFSALANALEIQVEDLHRLEVIWGAAFIPSLEDIRNRSLSLNFRLLNGSLSEYWRSTRIWWENIEKSFPQVLSQPVYFISSNPHSIANLLSGYALQVSPNLLKALLRDGPPALIEEWEEIQSGRTPASQENFFYYLLKKCQQVSGGENLVAGQRDCELHAGIRRIPSTHFFDVESQVIELSKLDPAMLDPRLNLPNIDRLCASDALLVNIDYPLGLAAYNILTKVAEHASPILGVYIIGKAATLNGVMGDVMIPNVVQDEHSQNTYLFNNTFSAADVAPYLIYGTVLDNQKAVSVLGTFLQNSRIMDVLYREGYTDIEMEAGPYLSAMYEMYRPQRHPVNEIVNLYGTPFEIGILHYASDTPLGKGKNLGAGTLSYRGMDSTYAASLAVLRHIFQVECERVGKKLR